MPYTDDERRKIADEVRRARIDQRLDKEPAARAAEVSSITWKRVEDAEGVRDASLGKILSSLGLPSAEELLREQPTIARADRAAGQTYMSNPDLPVTADGEPTVVHASRHVWNAVNDLADSPDGDPDRIWKARSAIASTADILTDFLLGLNAGPPAKPLLQEMAHKAIEIINQAQEERHVVEVEAEPDAQSETNEGKEVSVDGAKKGPVDDDFLGGLGDDPTVDPGEDDGEGDDLGRRQI